MSTFFGVVGMISMILSVGAIDGPTGMEQDNWGLCFLFAVIGIASFFLCLMFQTEEK